MMFGFALYVFVIADPGIIKTKIAVYSDEGSCFQAAALMKKNAPTISVLCVSYDARFDTALKVGRNP